jgi:hypothetical protein
MGDAQKMGDAERLLEGDLTGNEMDELLRRLRDDPSLRDEVTMRQLVRDAVTGLRALDDGYTLRILERLRRVAAPRRD